MPPENTSNPYMTMKRATTWYIAFLFLMLLSLFYLVKPLRKEQVASSYLWEHFLLRYEEQLKEYHNLSQAPDGVIIGPSYGLLLGDFDEFHNLSLAAARPRELESFIRRSSAETILYIVTIREASASRRQPRLSALCPFFRHLLILRAAGRSIIGMPGVGFDHTKRRASHEEWRIISQAIDLSKYPNISVKALAYQIILFSEDDISFKAFEALYEANPRVVFVISPLLPMKSVKGNSETAKSINQIIDRSAKLRRLFLDSNLPFIDLSDTLEPKSFVDLCHYTPDNREILRYHISSFLKEQTANSSISKPGSFMKLPESS
jgi:hypothetical protein